MSNILLCAFALCRCFPARVVRILAMKDCEQSSCGDPGAECAKGFRRFDPGREKEFLLRQKIMRSCWALLVCCLWAGCNAPSGGQDSPQEPVAASDIPTTEGYVEVPGGKVWYRKAGNGPGIPLVLLHGGPGYPGYHFESLDPLGDERPVISYDQLGCGKSDRPEDPSLWTIDRFIEELEAVRRGLGLTEIHLLGHSWGSMLATDYMLGDPEGVVSLVLASPALSVKRWTEDARRLLAQMPQDVQDAVARHEAAGTTDSEEYQAASTAFLKRHLCRLDPWPEVMDRILAGGNTDIYTRMWGPSEFTATGTLKNYERADRLGEIQIPTLFTCGRYDEATPETTGFYQSLVPGARMAVFENSSHMTMIEEPERYVAVLRDFLHEVEQQRR